MQYSHRLFVFLVVALLIGGCSASKRATNNDILRVMTFNIHHGEGVDGKVDIKRVAALIQESNADVVALQELDRWVERTDKIDIITMLAEMTGMTYAFGKNIDYQGGDYGNGLLTRFPILEERNLHYTMMREGEQRGLLQLVLDVRGQEMVVMNTHIDHREDDSERVMNVAEIREALQRYSPKPTIVCGDFNDLPASRTVALMKEDFIDTWEEVGRGDGFSYPTAEPVKRIDYIFIARPHPSAAVKLRPLSARVLRSDASDHLPVLVELELVGN
ncbi:MAG: endonuclease/exonuclease/phosphatase family protein [Bacteroidota bacterium]